MKQPANENWEKYYKRLTAEQLLFVTTNCFYSGRPTGQAVNDRLLPGVIWRDQLTHRQTEEPAKVKLDKALDRFYSGKGCNKLLKDFFVNTDDTIPMLKSEYVDITAFGENFVIWSEPVPMPAQEPRRPAWEAYREYNNKNDDPLGAYIVYHPLALRRIIEIRTLFLYGPVKDIELLVKEYQAGQDLIDRDNLLLPKIKRQLGGLVNKARSDFSFSGGKAIFTNLAGEMSSRIPKPEPGDDEEQRLLLTTEPFTFNEKDIQLTLDKSLLQALNSYRPDQGAQFKTWFYRIFKSDLIDLYREYKRGRIIKTIEEYQEELLNKINPNIDYIEAAELLPAAIYEQLNGQQLRWIALTLKVMPARISRNLAAEILGISERTENRIRRSLQEIVLNYKPVKKQAAEEPLQQPLDCQGCGLCSELFPNVKKKYFCYKTIAARRYTKEPLYYNGREFLQQDERYNLRAIMSNNVNMSALIE